MTLNTVVSEQKQNINIYSITECLPSDQSVIFKQVIFVLKPTL